MASADRIDPVDREYKRKARREWFIVLLILYFIVLAVYWGVIVEVPVDHRDQEAHFKYGSIGSDSDGGIPFWVWQVLPEAFPDKLPDPEAFAMLPPELQNTKSGYEQFGFIFEEGHDMPIGFSTRRVLVDRVGLNCAVCHVGTVQVTDGMMPERVYGKDAPIRYVAGAKGRGGGKGQDDAPDRVIISGMPAHGLDLTRYFQFLFDCANDQRFTADYILQHIDKKTRLGPLQRIIYSQAVPQMRDLVLLRRQQLGPLISGNPPAGPGRVDTFNPYKLMVFGFPHDGTIGTSDFPSIWNQRPREGMHLHWDGNNQSVFERNISASLGAGATPVSLDMPRMLRVAAWIGSPEPDPDKIYTDEYVKSVRTDNVPREDELQIPKYPFKVDDDLAYGLGRSVWIARCASCHEWDGAEIGQVVPIDEINTDRYRLDSYSRDLASNQWTLGSEQWWRFQHFRKTNGYSNMPLDGIWARAPYLHNGSVPNLRELLKKPEERRIIFYRGDDAYDPENVGFRSDRAASSDGRKFFKYDTRLPGNSNSGHDYGTDLPDEQIEALIEYMKNL